MSLRRLISSRWVAAALFAGAFALRTGVAVIAAHRLPVSGVALSDNARNLYLPLARNLAEGKPYNISAAEESAKSPPVYPWLLSLWLRAFGENLTVLRLIQAALDALLAVVVWRLGVLLFDPAVGLAAGAMTALYPFLAYFSLSVGPETVFTCALGFATLALVAAHQRDSLWRFALAGGVFGIATLTRATTLLLPFCLAALMLLWGRWRGRAFARAALLLGGFLLVLSPWTARNWVVLGRFIPVSTGAGSVMLQGSDKQFFTIEGKRGAYRQYFDELAARGVRPPPAGGEYDYDRFAMQAGIERYKIRLDRAPWSLAPFMGEKLVRMWYATENGWHQGKILAVQLALAPFVVAGLWLLRRRRLGEVQRQGLLLIGAIVAYFMLVHWMLLPLARYMVPAMPLIMLFAGNGLVAAARLIWRRGAAAQRETAKENRPERVVSEEQGNVP